MTNALRTILALVLGTAAFVACADDGQAKLPVVRINAGIHNILAEVAETPDQHEVGLMFRKTMGTSEGMLFIFDEPAKQCFWMKNTLLPLSAAFIANDGTIVNIEDMKPLTLESHCSAKPVRFVLEMNQGWFAKRGIKAGERLQGQPFTKR
jgi:uncharacterized protein